MTQKFSQYGVFLIIIGNFLPNKSDSLTAYIKESNHGKHVNFFNSTEEAFTKLNLWKEVFMAAYVMAIIKETQFG